MFFLLIISPFSRTMDNQLIRQLDIQRGLFADQYQVLQMQGQDVYYLLQENTNAIARGVAVLVADRGISMVGDQNLTALARELNKLGWITMNFSGPDLIMPIVADFPPTATENSDNGNQAETETVPATDNNENIATDGNDSVADNSPIPTAIRLAPALSKLAASAMQPAVFAEQEQRLVALLQEAAEQALQYPGFLLVIGQGSSAAWLTSIYAQQKLDSPDAFVAISAHWPDREYNRTLPGLMANTAMPVLDLYHQSDNTWVVNTASIRAIEAVKSLKLQYRQRQLLGNSRNPQQVPHLSKEIYGWLSHMGW
jgi:hypothetical protein